MPASVRRTISQSLRFSVDLLIQISVMRQERCQLLSVVIHFSNQTFHEDAARMPHTLIHLSQPPICSALPAPSAIPPPAPGRLNNA
jgi:hypothetical protein